MAAQDLRTNLNFSRLPRTIRDSRGQFFYVTVPGSVLDLATGDKTLCNLPKGTRVLDCKLSVNAVQVGATTYALAVKVFDGTTTSQILNVADSVAVAQTRAPGATTTNPDDILLNGTSNQLIVTVTVTGTATTNPSFTLLLTVARENT